MSKTNAYLALIFYALLYWAVGSALLMLLVGVIHHEYTEDIPTMSFRAAALIWAVYLVLHTFVSGSATDKS